MSSNEKVKIGVRKTLKGLIICPHCNLPIAKWDNIDIEVTKGLADALRKAAKKEASEK